MSRSMRMSVEVEGLDEALRRLKAYDTKSTEKISEAIRLGGQNIKKHEAVFRAEAANCVKVYAQGSTVRL